MFEIVERTAGERGLYPFFPPPDGFHRMARRTSTKDPTLCAKMIQNVGGGLDREGN
jgi:hypothetical protein